MRRFLTLLLDVTDQADQVDTSQDEYEVDTRLLGQGDPAEIENLGRQVNALYKHDMNYPPVQHIRVRGIDDGHIFEECEDADKRPWWRIG